MPSGKLDQEGCQQTSGCPKTSVGGQGREEYQQEQTPQGSEEGRSPGQTSPTGSDPQQTPPTSRPTVQEVIWPDLMLDLEYLAGSTSAVVVQIGAMPFDLALGKYDPSLFFSVNLSIEEQLQVGRKIDARTLEWWMGQAVEKNGVPPWFKDPQPVKSSLERLTSFVAEHCDPYDVKVWSHVSCDAVKVGDICEKNSAHLPWLWKNCQHITTLVYLSGVRPPKHTAKDHEAVQDCIRQIDYCCRCYKVLKNLDRTPEF